MSSQLAVKEQVISQIESFNSVEQALHCICELYPVGHATYHMLQTVVLDQYVDAPYVKTTYPDKWVARYILKDYIKVDPIVRAGALRSLPFDWSSINPRQDATQMLEDYHSHDLGPFGYSIPITDKKGRRALFSVNSMPTEQLWNELTSRYLKDWLELARILHQKAIFELYGNADPAPSLSKRQIETLNLSAAGLDHKQIAKELNISEHTVRNYQQSLRHKLGATSMTQAVAIASQLKIISYN
jgi:DNA-binding CsgD family transcriptional regulator